MKCRNDEVIYSITQCLALKVSKHREWYFPLAQAQKKCKMFSRTWLGPEEIRVLAGGAGLVSMFLLLLGKA